MFRRVAEGYDPEKAAEEIHSRSVSLTKKRDALIEGLLDGTIDMLVTDHAPHSREEKARGLEKSAMGVVGLETSFAASYTALVQTGILPLGKLVDLMHGAPMRRFGCGTELAEGL